jgi:hypothetical protein
MTAAEAMMGCISAGSSRINVPLQFLQLLSLVGGCLSRLTEGEGGCCTLAWAKI